MKEKLLILFGIVLLLLVILVLRITYINATSGSKYKKQVLSQAQQKYESQELPAKRGDIYDKNGNILATSNKVYNVILDCKTVNSDEDYVEPTIRALNEVLGIDEETVRSLLADSRTSQSQYQVLTKQLSMDKKKEFEKYKAEDEDSGLTKAQAKERANIKGVWFEEDYLRSYPFNETACDTIGFALDRDVADIGLEGYYNSTLTGVDGRQYGYINDDSDVEQTIIAAVNGKSIQTSIDIGAQQIVEKYVNGFKEAMGAKNIGVIAMKPSTGEIIAMNHSFHGRSIGALSVTGTAHYREPFEPLMGGVKFADFNDLESVKAQITDKTCAIITEVVQGEGGIYPAKKEFLEGLRQICDEKDIMLIFDEIQCGMGRTGHYFAWQAYGVQPDIMTSAKALGCGVPVGAFVLNEKAAKASLEPGDHGTTYGGNPFVCAAVSKVFDIFEQDNILAHVQELTPYLEEKLDALVDKCPIVAARRGKGFMQGLVIEGTTVGSVVTKALANGLLVISAGRDVLRLVPPLVITKEQIDEMIEKLEKSLA